MSCVPGTRPVFLALVRVCENCLKRAVPLYSCDFRAVRAGQRKGVAWLTIDCAQMVDREDVIEAFARASAEPGPSITLALRECPSQVDGTVRYLLPLNEEGTQCARPCSLYACHRALAGGRAEAERRSQTAAAVEARASPIDLPRPLPMPVSTPRYEQLGSGERREVDLRGYLGSYNEIYNEIDPVNLRRVNFHCSWRSSKLWAKKQYLLHLMRYQERLTRLMPSRVGTFTRWSALRASKNALCFNTNSLPRAPGSVPFGHPPVESGDASAANGVAAPLSAGSARRLSDSRGNNSPDSDAPARAVGLSESADDSIELDSSLGALPREKPERRTPRFGRTYAEVDGSMPGTFVEMVRKSEV